MENRNADVGHDQADTYTEDSLAEVRMRDAAASADQGRQTGLSFIF